FIFFFQAEDGIRDRNVTGVQTCALPICRWCRLAPAGHRLSAHRCSADSGGGPAGGTRRTGTGGRDRSRCGSDGGHRGRDRLADRDRKSVVEGKSGGGGGGGGSGAEDEGE